MTVLIAYATAHGSTRDIADRLADRLREHGHVVDSRPVEAVSDAELATYDAVLLGSAVHGRAWLPPAVDFARRNAAVLAQRPVWLFSVSSLGERSSAFPEAVARRLRAHSTQLADVVAVSAALRPRGSHDFAGVISPSDWGLAGKAFMTMMRGRYGDLRDLGEIDDWAETVAADLARDRA